VKAAFPNDVGEFQLHVYKNPLVRTEAKLAALIQTVCKLKDPPKIPLPISLPNVRLTDKRRDNIEEVLRVLGMDFRERGIEADPIPNILVASAVVAPQIVGIVTATVTVRAAAPTVGRILGRAAAFLP
jgi:hypothetical protein